MLFGITFVDGGFRPAIAKEGRKWTHIVYVDGSRVRVNRSRKVPAFRPIEGYTESKLARRLLRKKTALGLKREVSKAAEKILREAAGGAR